MKGNIIIDSKGEITTTLPTSNDDTNDIGLIISNILQDINTYMRMNHNTMGELKKTTLRLGSHHEVNIVVGND